MFTIVTLNSDGKCQNFTILMLKLFSVLGYNITRITTIVSFPYELTNNLNNCSLPCTINKNWKKRIMDGPCLPEGT